MPPDVKIVAASRVFALAATIGLLLSEGDWTAFTGLLALATVAGAAIYLSLLSHTPPIGVIAVEAALTALIIGLALPDSLAFLPYLVVLFFIAGMSRGTVGVTAVTAVEVLTLSVVLLGHGSTELMSEFVRLLSPWALTGIAMGLLGAWVRGVAPATLAPSDEATYAAASRLLSQLRLVARHLSVGLDSSGIAGRMVQEVMSLPQAVSAAVFVRTAGPALAPLAYSSDDAKLELRSASELIRDCLDELEPITRYLPSDQTAHDVALPIRVGSRGVGVVLVRTESTPESLRLPDLVRKIDEDAIRLEAALIFDEIRTVATTEERHRLAREIHDGVAQEVASLGYLVDDIVGCATTDELRRPLITLRQHITRVVSELRLSIFDLRTVVPETGGLGSALAEAARHLGRQAEMTVHLSLNESAERLRLDQEVELLRIAQEAVSNARRHSGARNIWIDCRVDPPLAELTIRDDGVGLKPGRHDSYGLHIMRERASRIGAQLEIVSNAGSLSGSGTEVKVVLGTRRPDSGRAWKGADNAIRQDPQSTSRG